MNYRHIYHAGNFADVIKHITMCLCLERLRDKEKPFFVLDAHGGCGLYDLQSEQAQKTLEYEDGIARVMALEETHPALQSYLNVMGKDWEKGNYPGSPLIAARMLRPQDRLVANELHPEDVETLRGTLNFMAGVRENILVTSLDAYESIRAQVPPKERRGLVLIDPPFEKKDEFDTLARQMEQWHRRWETGTFIIWYPIKSHLSVSELYKAATLTGFNRSWVCEHLLHDRHQEGTLNGCGLIVMNAPFQVPEQLESLIPLLTKAMGGRFETRWLTPA